MWNDQNQTPHAPSQVNQDTGFDCEVESMSLVLPFISYFDFGVFFMSAIYYTAQMCTSAT